MGRLRGFLWLIAGVVVAAIAAGIAFIALSRATADRVELEQVVTPQRSVVVAVQRVDVQGVLTEENVEVIEVPVDTAPESAVTDIDDVLGKITLVELYPGEVLLAQRVLDPNVIAPDGRLALVMNEEQVLLALPAGDLINQVNMLKAGDHVDFLYSYELPIDREGEFLPGAPAQEGAVEGEAAEEEPTEQVTFNLLQNAVISQIVRQLDEDGQPTGAPRALLLAVDPQEALVLKYMKDVGAVVDLVLRAPGAEGEFEVEPVDLDYIIDSYIVPQEGTP
ncbi:MAG: Flp pilus assembly protein CpaB [Anaerolineae bacterium]|nr:Flp pilus assembly protein CpaB [Anaerolineae bacterium]